MDIRKFLEDKIAQIDAGGLQDVGLAIGILAVIGFVDSLKLTLSSIWRSGIIYIVNEIYGIAAITTGSVFWTGVEKVTNRSQVVKDLLRAGENHQHRLWTSANSRYMKNRKSNTFDFSDEGSISRVDHNLLEGHSWSRRSIANFQSRAVTSPHVLLF